MLVKDVMSSPVITTDEEAPSNKIAKMMDENKFGCVVVTDNDGKPLGIITERDLVIRVVASNVKPDMIKAKAVMSTPMVTIDPDATISDAARRMSRLDIRRLGVVYKGDIIGVISNKDILAVMPDLLETILEKHKIEASAEGENEEPPQSGYCDRCGVYSENLKESDGQNICEDCRIEAEQEQ